MCPGPRATSSSQPMVSPCRILIPGRSWTVAMDPSVLRRPQPLQPFPSRRAAALSLLSSVPPSSHLDRLKPSGRIAPHSNLHSPTHRVAPSFNRSFPHSQQPGLPTCPPVECGNKPYSLTDMPSIQWFGTEATVRKAIDTENLLEQVEKEGFSLVPRLLEPAQADRLVQSVSDSGVAVTRSRGVRNLASRIPDVAHLAASAEVRLVVDAVRVRTLASCAASSLTK